MTHEKDTVLLNTTNPRCQPGRSTGNEAQVIRNPECIHPIMEGLDENKCKQESHSARRGSIEHRRALSKLDIPDPDPEPAGTKYREYIPHLSPSSQSRQRKMLNKGPRPDNTSSQLLPQQSLPPLQIELSSVGQNTCISALDLATDSSPVAVSTVQKMQSAGTQTPSFTNEISCLKMSQQHSANSELLLAPGPTPLSERELQAASTRPWVVLGPVHLNESQFCPIVATYESQNRAKSAHPQLQPAIPQPYSFLPDKTQAIGGIGLNATIRNTPRETTPNNQIPLILEYVSKGIHAGASSVFDILNVVQHDKVLWLALHGVPSRSLAYEMRIEIGQQANKLAEKDAQALEQFIRMTIGTIACGGDPNPNAVVERLMAQAAQHFDSKTPQKSMEHAVLDEGGKITAGRKGRAAIRRAQIRTEKMAAKEMRKAKTSAEIGPGSPNSALRLARKMSLDETERMQFEKKIAEKIGFTSGDVEGQKAVLKERLVGIRETGVILQILDEKDRIID